jgi:acetamidase/formamidase
VFVRGAEPGDVLEVEILDVEPDRYGYTVQVLHSQIFVSLDRVPR